jgi:hypothetical protein
MLFLRKVMKVFHNSENVIKEALINLGIINSDTYSADIKRILAESEVPFFETYGEVAFPSITLQHIRMARNKLCLQFHPDKISLSRINLKNALEQIQKINEAYETIVNSGINYFPNAPDLPNAAEFSFINKPSSQVKVEIVDYSFGLPDTSKELLIKQLSGYYFTIKIWYNKEKGKISPANVYKALLLHFANTNFINQYAQQNAQDYAAELYFYKDNASTCILSDEDVKNFIALWGIKWVAGGRILPCDGVGINVQQFVYKYSNTNLLLRPKAENLLHKTGNTNIFFNKAPAVDKEILLIEDIKKEVTLKREDPDVEGDDLFLIKEISNILDNSNTVNLKDKAQEILEKISEINAEGSFATLAARLKADFPQQPLLEF